MTNDTAFEKHYTITELAELWQFSKERVRREVQKEPGVVALSGPSGKTTYRIPESVARRIHTRLTAPRQRPQLVQAR